MKLHFVNLRFCENIRIWQKKYIASCIPGIIIESDGLAGFVFSKRIIFWYKSKVYKGADSKKTVSP